jgi:hypothetical protein
MPHPMRGDHSVIKNPLHPVYTRLTNSRQAFARHVVLHELERHLGDVQCTDALARKVRQFVSRGVPYFSPSDEHYREWAEQVANYWDSIDALPRRGQGAPAAPTGA